MRRLRAAVLGLALGVCPPPASGFEPLPERDEKPRLVVLTDISADPDDAQSLVRLLLYSNEIELEGLLATTSAWLRDRVRPDLIVRHIRAYARVRETLATHAHGYPSAELLRGMLRPCPARFGMSGVGAGSSSPGSEHIIQVVDREDDRAVWVAIWGGSNCLAQALWDVRGRRTPEETRRFVSRLRVYAISDQDDSGPWIRRNFPELFYIVSPSGLDSEDYRRATWSGISGDRLFDNGPGYRFDLVDNPWLVRNVIRDHGALGSVYPRIKFLMEGDSPSFLNLVRNGLAAHESPDYGGWGGRYRLQQPSGESRPIWTDTTDSVRVGADRAYTSGQATVWRWREAYQHDFAARMDWCIASGDAANHPPDAAVNASTGTDPVRIAAEPGDRISLSAAGSSDRDGDPVAFRWFHYREAGPARDDRPEVRIAGPASPEASLRVPASAAGDELHIILEVKDAGTPALSSYRRVIVRVNGPGSKP